MLNKSIIINNNSVNFDKQISSLKLNKSEAGAIIEISEGKNVITYSLSKVELIALKEFLDENCKMDF